jgi:hypothetical protein
MKKLLILSLLAVSLRAQLSENLIRILPVPGTGSGSVGRVDFYDNTRTYAVHVNALPGLTANIPWVWPSIADVSGNCLISGGLGRWNPGSCLGSPPLTTTLNSASTTLTVSNSGAGHALDVPSGATSLQALAIAGAFTGTHAQNVGSGDAVSFGLVSSTLGVLIANGGITANGNTTPALSTIANSGGGPALNVTTGGTISMGFTDSGGTCRMSFGAGGVTCPSDARLKTAIIPLGSDLGRILKLRPVSFKWKSNGESADGLIAQEVLKVFPRAVHRAPDGYLNISYQQLVPYLIRAMQDEQREIYGLAAWAGLLSIAVIYFLMRK